MGHQLSILAQAQQARHRQLPSYLMGHQLQIGSPEGNPTGGGDGEPSPTDSNGGGNTGTQGSEGSGSLSTNNGGASATGGNGGDTGTATQGSGTSNTVASQSSSRNPAGSGTGGGQPSNTDGGPNAGGQTSASGSQPSATNSQGTNPSQGAGTTGSSNGQPTGGQSSSVTTTGQGSSPTDGSPTSCSDDSDCVVDTELCISGGLNICTCVNAVCVPTTDPDGASTAGSASSTAASGTQGTNPSTPTESGEGTPCTDDDDCLADVSLCLSGTLNLCTCVDAVCVRDTTTSGSQVSSTASGNNPGSGAGGSGTTTAGESATQTGSACSTSDDCVANVALCLVGGLNLCVCVDAVCQLGPDSSNGGGGDDDPTTTARAQAAQTSVPCANAEDCTAALGLSVLGIYVCVDLICQLQPTANPTNGGTTASQTGSIAVPTITEPIDCATDQDCVAALGANALGIFACIDLLCEQTATASGAGASATQPAASVQGTDVECSTDQDCVAAIGVGALGIFACVNLLCQQTATASVVTTATNTGVSASASTTDVECATDQDCVAALGAQALGLFVCINALCQETTSTAGAGPSTTQPPSPGATTDIECSTNQDCVAAIGANALGIFACIDLICQQTANPSSGFVTVTSGNTATPTGSSETPCSDDSDCTVAGQTCAADGFCRTPSPSTGNGGASSCSDSVDCLLSLQPLCALGLCVCLNAVCSPPSDVDPCTTNSQCNSGQTCQQEVCVDDVSCSTENDCVANLDLCTSLGICACVNGLCTL
ncbi:hypothetical protein FOVG_05459 [Fusarium oxysporum f. sp. pisi HDV247]|uniref:Uncharacterized protein n=1 Tax=Fusarium oxysporum f. sp. pisi HDV247 TaxID=1080344 RepID=W9Q2L8_FUSOX|nr:hypothetical protein FOVG_05459 [Fusarium oxysporum f. sp. pisi HDV247]